MTGKQRIINALTFQDFDIVPIEARDSTGTPYVYPGWFTGGYPNKRGRYTDGWGCVWEALEDGVCGEVKYHPLAEENGGWSKLDSFRPPYHILGKADLSQVNKACEQNRDKFIINEWEPPMPNIFERMQHLRGTEQLFMDLAYGDAEIYRLRDMLFEYYEKQMEMWCNTDVDAVHIHDDWGTQISLLISPEAWREYFKPVYKRFCEIAKKHNKFVLMHSDGYIRSIIPDLIEIGINAINSQLFCMPIEELAAEFHHKICFWGEIDRQFIQPFGSVQDMYNACDRIANAFFRYGKTGFVAIGYYTMNTPEENKKAEFDRWAYISERLDSYKK